MGDPLCDDALRAVFQSSSSTVGKDLLANLERYVAANPGNGPAHTFLRHVSQRPSAGLQVTAQDAELAQSVYTFSRGGHMVRVFSALICSVVAETGTV